MPRCNINYDITLNSTGFSTHISLTLYNSNKYFNYTIYDFCIGYVPEALTILIR